MDHLRVSGDCYSGMLQGGRRDPCLVIVIVFCVRLSPYCTRNRFLLGFFCVEVILFVLPGVENIISP